MHQLHLPAEQAAAGVDLLDPHLETVQLFLPGARVLAGERDRGADDDVLGMGNNRGNNDGENC